MWPSLEVASWLYDGANIGLIIGLILGVVSTVLIVWMGNTKEEYLKRDLANTHERAAKAELLAANTNLELEKFKAPRSLAVEQHVRIIENLKNSAEPHSRS